MTETHTATIDTDKRTGRNRKGRRADKANERKQPFKQKIMTMEFNGLNKKKNRK